MNESLTNHGRCSFFLPAGFTQQKDPTTIADTPGEACTDCGKGEKEPVSFVLQSPGGEPAPVTEAGQSKISEDAVAATISIFTQPAKFAGEPLAYLRNADGILAKSLEEYQSDFCNSDWVQGKPAAMAQASFGTQVRIYRLVIAWCLDGDFLLASFITTQKKVDWAWTTLKAFAGSVQLR